MGKEGDVDEEEMPKIGNCEVKKIIMSQGNVNIIGEWNILNLTF